MFSEFSRGSERRALHENMEFSILRCSLRESTEHSELLRVDRCNLRGNAKNCELSNVTFFVLFEQSYKREL